MNDVIIRLRRRTEYQLKQMIERRDIDILISDAAQWSNDYVKDAVKAAIRAYYQSNIDDAKNRLAGLSMVQGAIAASRCDWEYVEEFCGDSYWVPGCSEESKWVFLEAGPKENEMVFCPSCGLRVRV
jgi:hypothetical protein